MKTTRNIITRLITDYKRLDRQKFSLHVSGCNNMEKYTVTTSQMDYIKEMLLFIGYKEIELADLLIMNRLTYGVNNG